MGRVSRVEAQTHRDEVVRAASHMFRERGVQAVSVAEVMADAGLTHGGFYRHFPSKDALVAEAAGSAFGAMGQRLAEVDASSDTHPDAVSRFLDGYLSVENRDDAANGCPTTGFGPDVARTDDAAVRASFAEGVERFAAWLADDGETADAESLARLSTMVGALLLSRATSTTALSERILAAARDSLRR
ncbi:MAG: TetR/AcrR family transcriptional regulator [Herbiconiux sp.]|uniref:TetR/AcrR family transcriptional regulator n=1 Tax=Herbiconiux sp. TaxID=1871186 RepID=UPI00120FD7B0|nr:TetR/AcrR family transcriptional regulator [Herbiconiux sp.]TAJ49417.1 MAG: TetR/AcrR family transcriptional regulator [Herbiconiux sp.]